ncbi:hypothetical protein EV44_g0267 [Erysiphe necator]|uniref:Uncharacterized protein n=1 Tax=Uncinula necator TaxID=52586 RepID=A0A0B1PG63_UNCNE|nr:hypothetical protein EV44_g0267 [Erysiphe necator]
MIQPVQAAVIFLLGTKGIGWLDNWRDTKALECDNKFASLEYMISSLRAVEANTTPSKLTIYAASIAPNKAEGCNRSNNQAEAIKLNDGKFII